MGEGEGIERERWEGDWRGFVVYGCCGGGCGVVCDGRFRWGIEAMGWEVGAFYPIFQLSNCPVGIPTGITRTRTVTGRDGGAARGTMIGAIRTLDGGGVEC